MKNAAEVANTLRDIFNHTHSNTTTGTSTTTGKNSNYSQSASADVVFFEDLPATSQALLMSQTDLIIAPHGAGLVNIAFMRPCSIVIEVSCCCLWMYICLCIILMEHFPRNTVTNALTACCYVFHR